MNKKFGFTKPSRADLRTDGVKRVRIANRLSVVGKAQKRNSVSAEQIQEGMSTECESRTRVCRNRAFDSKCERFRLSRGAVASSGTKAAFTLAEVLITLAIVGVVAALTMPALITNIQDRVKTARIQNITQKFGKATDKMKSLSTLGGYATTMDFVNELQKHLKIAKVCDNQHLTQCWPTEKVIINDEGKEWEISKTKTGKQLKMENDDTHEYGDTVGIVTADGTAMILTYNAKCDIDETPVTWANDKSSTSGCVAAVFDWNGSKMPNKLSDDVINFNSNGLGNICAFKIGGKCFNAATTVSKAATKAECEAMKSTHGIKSCDYDTDYWAGAVRDCGHVDKMASLADIAAIASHIYGVTIGETTYKSGISYNGSIAATYGFPTAIAPGYGFNVWSGTGSEEGRYRNFWADSTGESGYYAARYDSSTLVLCKGD